MFEIPTAAYIFMNSIYALQPPPDPNSYVYNKSIIYVFYNNTPCKNCEKAVEILEQTYEQYFQDKYDFYVVNYENYPQYNYQKIYNLSKPLTVILVKIKNGKSAGIYRMNNLQASVINPSTLKVNFRTKVRTFFGK